MRRPGSKHALLAGYPHPLVLRHLPDGSSLLITTVIRYRYAGLPYQHRLLDALMRVKLGTPIPSKTCRCPLTHELGPSARPWSRRATGGRCMPKGENRYNEMSTMNESLEYVAFERPVVALDLHDVRIPTGDAVVYVKRDDVGDYAEAIASLLDDEDNWAGWYVSTTSRACLVSSGTSATEVSTSAWPAYPRPSTGPAEV